MGHALRRPARTQVRERLFGSTIGGGAARLAWYGVGNSPRVVSVGVWSSRVWGSSPGSLPLALGRAGGRPRRPNDCSVVVGWGSAGAREPRHSRAAVLD